MQKSEAKEEEKGNSMWFVNERYTYREYLKLPEDGKIYQIIGGRLHRIPAPTPHHQRILKRLSRLLDEYISEHGIGEIFIAPCDVVLSEEDVVQPDIFFISGNAHYL